MSLIHKNAAGPTGRELESIPGLRARFLGRSAAAAGKRRRPPSARTRESGEASRSVSRATRLGQGTGLDMSHVVLQATTIQTHSHNAAPKTIAASSGSRPAACEAHKDHQVGMTKFAQHADFLLLDFARILGNEEVCGPHRLTAAKIAQVSGVQNSYILNSFDGNDFAYGSLRNPLFCLRRPRCTQRAYGAYGGTRAQTTAPAS